MELILPTCSVARPPTLIAFCAVRNLPSFPFNCLPNSNWL